MSFFCTIIGYSADPLSIFTLRGRTFRLLQSLIDQDDHQDVDGPIAQIRELLINAVKFRLVDRVKADEAAVAADFFLIGKNVDVSNSVLQFEIRAGGRLALTRESEEAKRRVRIYSEQILFLRRGDFESPKSEDLFDFAGQSAHVFVFIKFVSIFF
jgi:hypothetical protein